MEVLSLADFQENPDQVLDRVAARHRPVVITQQNGEAAVLISLADWYAIEETSHLLSTANNAARLAEAMGQLNRPCGASERAIEP